MDLLKKITVSLFFIGALIIVGRVFFITHYLDLETFYLATRTYYADGNPYRQIAGASVGFLYPPTSFLFLSPLILLPIKIAGIAWTVISLVLLSLSIALLFKIVKRKVLSYEFFGILGLVLMMFPVKFSLGLGQVSILNLFFVVLFMYFMNIKKEKLGGILLALSVLLKFSPLLFPLYFVLTKNWKLLLSMFVTVSFISLAVTLFRPDQMIYFLTQSLPGTFKSWPLDYYNQALSGMLGRWIGRGELAQVLRLCISFFMILVTARVLWKKTSQNLIGQLQYAPILPLSIIIAPLAWQHYFVLVIPTLILLYFSFKKRNALFIEYIILALSYFLVAWNIKQPGQMPLIIQSHVLYGAVLLWWQSLREVKKYE